MTTTPDRLEEIRARLSRATPGPWVVEGGDSSEALTSVMAMDDCVFHAVCACDCNTTCRGTIEQEENAELIAAAPEDIQYLITRLEASEAEVERLTRNLGGRDEFLVSKGLFMEFVGSLPKERPNSSTAPARGQHERPE